jgi:flagellar biosynthetic protein FliO
MPPLKIAVMLGLVLGWTGLAAAQSAAPADAARPTARAEDLPSLDGAAARFRSSQETNVGFPAGRIANPSTNRVDPADRLTTSPTQDGLAIRPTGKTPPSSPTSSIPQTPRGGDRLAISPSHHVRLGEPGSRPGGTSSLLTVGSSLAVVLGLFLLVAWVFKRAMPGQSGLLPKEVVEVLGRTSLGARQQVHLVRCGNKLLLVSSTPGGMETLTEIAEPDEVQRLSALCRQTQPGSSTAAFRQVFQQLATGASHDA